MIPINPDKLRHIRIPVRSGKGMRWVKLLAVAYIKGEGKASAMVDVKKNKFADFRTIGIHEALLSEYGIFLRVHRSYIVNTCYVSGCTTHNRRLFVMLDNGTKIPMAKNKREPLIAAMNFYVPQNYKIIQVVKNTFTP